MTQSKLRSWIRKVDDARITYCRGDLCLSNMVTLLIDVKDQLEYLKVEMIEEYHELKAKSAKKYAKRIKKT